MKIQRALIALGLGALFIALKADDCIIEDRMVEAVVTQTLPYVWHTEGDNSAGVDTAAVSLADDVEDAIEEFAGDVTVQTAHISGGTYRVLENRGFVGAHSGTVTIEAEGQAPLTILTFAVANPPGNSAGATGGTGVDVTLEEGIGFLNDRIDDYLDSRETGADPSLLEFTFRANWTSDDPGEAEYDFDWETALILQIVGLIEVQVPDP